MGLSKPRPRRKVDSMKRMPRRERMDVTLSVIIIAWTWLGVALTAMMAGHLQVNRALEMVSSAPMLTIW